MTGHLFLVVGPSGAGKDTLLDAARAHFTGNPNVIFPRRYITRPCDAGGEDHIATSEDEFNTLKKQGLFAFHWGAHDLHYGIPLQINGALESGINVVVNVSRGAIEFVRENYDNVSVISIVVDQAILAERLKARGRENENDISRRLDRAKSFSVSGNDVITIDNSGLMHPAVKQFISVVSKSAKRHTLKLATF